MNKIPICIALLVASSAMVPPGSAAETTPQELTERSIHRRAVEAVIWGIPAVNYERMLQAALDSGAKANQVVYWSQPVNWKNQTLTPNPDTIYLNPFYDTRGGPVVVEIPPADADHVIVGSFDVAWQNALEDIGPAGADKGKGAKYLITPPGYDGKVPEGYIVLPSETYRGFVILRSNFKSRSPADIRAAVDHGKRVRVYPLGGDQDSTVFVDAFDKPFDATIPYDASFFELLDRFVQIEPWLTRDKVMIDSLRTLGIEKGKAFNPSEITKRILTEAVREAREVIGLKYEGGFTPAFYEGTRWSVPVPRETVDGLGSHFANPNEYGLDGRAVMYHMAYFSPKVFGGGQFYLINISDKAGKALDGGRTYRLTVPGDAPVEQYWSASLYDRATHALIKGMSRPSLASNDGAVAKNADGSVDIFFAPVAPAGKESNWVPTDPKGRFEVLFRLYGPKKELFAKEWKLPDIEEVK
ncbi:DUF1254 domain-containing protein [Luteolibacter yonseiensis]|uniref:DUF1254 domain-containing protein n=1 Tax=Luteolibacter yonseiensis TaxID=1144680 RepID=A0A934V9E4_9BACT|nr:DUF1254 domain-containing protein [Luteolibacter yonseiensis]MBK1814085.1 DUF1254 domain-containing protein [Luteolibacter yonseiensis]